MKKNLQWINSEFPVMCRILEEWTNIDSGTENLPGLAEMLHHLRSEFSSLGGTIEEITLPKRKIATLSGGIEEKLCGKALSVVKRAHAPIQVLLGGHMDIVRPENDLFHPCKKIGSHTLQGRGSADMKGGLAVLLFSLKALEMSPFANQIGWQVIINPDEEIGSPCSLDLFRKAAPKHHLGMIFEPSLPDGSLVCSRKGSATFSLSVKGKSAHAGRDFFSGKNALTAACRFALDAESLTDERKEITINIAKIESPGAVNIVPDRALCLFNLRARDAADFAAAKEKLKQMAKGAPGIEMELWQNTERPPKPFDERTKVLFENIKKTAESLGIDLSWQPSGGVCDGNILAESGLPTVDTLGVVGGNLHTAEEYMMLESLKERTNLSASFLINLAEGKLQLG